MLTHASYSYAGKHYVIVDARTLPGPLQQPRLPLAVAAAGPRAIALAVEAVDVGLDCGLEEGLRFEAAAFGLTAATDDRREGTRAFLEKRKPAFAGK